MSIKSTRNKVIGFCCILLAVIAAVVGIILYSQPKQQLPKNILSQASFPIYFPDKDQVYTLNKSSVKYDSSIKLLSFSIQGHTGRLDLNEQAKPGNFSSNLLLLEFKDLHPITFKSKLGRIIMVKDKKLAGNTTILEAGKTLIFVQSDELLGQTDWQDFYSNLQQIN